ncbi:MAG: hypothetical protein JWN04_6617 [Myxococcaceae bacterium]|nr:hypothetical protein [Myxococcaceae bacterium]
MKDRQQSGLPALAVLEANWKRIARGTERHDPVRPEPAQETPPLDPIEEVRGSLARVREQMTQRFETTAHAEVLALFLRQVEEAASRALSVSRGDLVGHEGSTEQLSDEEMSVQSAVATLEQVIEAFVTEDAFGHARR